MRNVTRTIASVAPLFKPLILSFFIYVFQPKNNASIETVSKNLLLKFNDEDPLDVSSLLKPRLSAKK